VRCLVADGHLVEKSEPSTTRDLLVAARIKVDVVTARILTRDRVRVLLPNVPRWAPVTGAGVKVIAACVVVVLIACHTLAINTGWVTLDDMRVVIAVVGGARGTLLTARVVITVLLV
jgi:hypothetical protein